MLADAQPKILWFFLPHRGVHVKHDEPVDDFHSTIFFCVACTTMWLVIFFCPKCLVFVGVA